MVKIFNILFILGLISCAAESPNDRGSDNPNEKYVSKEGVIFQGDLVFNETSKSINQEQDGKLLFSQDVSTGYTFSIENNPSNIDINSTTGYITLDSSGSAAGVYENIIIKANEMAGSSGLQEIISVALNGDPLREYAWHLENTGQKTFMLISGSSGYDLNGGEVFRDGITGKGVRIAVSDSGVEYNHDDLIKNELTGQHRDYSLSPPYEGSPTPTSAHGTAVAGIISATGWNNLGSIGVAPNSKFGAFQFLESAQNTSLLIHQSSGDFDVFNYSYGDAIFQDNLSDSDYLDHLRYQTITDNKVFVKAAGNEFLLGEETTCASHNANFPFENESPFLIIAGAISADGVKATYSSHGANLWVSAPGGEGSARSFEPRILTTDLPTCFKGYSKVTSGLENDFEYGHSLNKQCHYTSVMNGTSSATPMVTGVIALLREANPSLKMRDIKHIFASTSVKIDPDHLANDFGKVHPSNLLSGCEKLNLEGHEYEQGWVTNTAGYHFNNFYGFGLIDAKAAVAAAKSYTSTLGELIEQNIDFSESKFSTGTLNSPIPDNNSSGQSSSITISSGDSLTVESVQVRVKVAHGASGQLGVELTAPSGIKSILMNINNSFLLLDKDEDGTLEGDSDLDIVLTSNAFYGESSEGAWTLKVIDGASGTTGTITHWKINILGHN